MGREHSRIAGAALICSLLCACPSEVDRPPPSTAIAADAGPVKLEGRLRLLETDSENPAASRLLAAVASDPLAAELEIRVGSVSLADRFADYPPVRTLIGKDRAALASTLDRIFAAAPELKPGPDAALVFQEERDTLTGKDGETQWRAYWTSTTTAIEPAFLLSAKQDTDATGMPVINLELMKDDGTAFEAMTRRAVGRPILIVVGDTVVSAPIVYEPIPGGKVSINLGYAGSDKTKLPEEAQSLLKTIIGPQ